MVLGYSLCKGQEGSLYSMTYLSKQANNKHVFKTTRMSLKTAMYPNNGTTQ